MWTDQLTQITIHYRLDVADFKYQLFNLLHLLEHCLLQKNKHYLDSNGGTYNFGGYMSIMFVAKTSDIPECIDLINDLVKTKHLNYKLELQRLGAEMYQWIDEESQLQYPEFMFNKDIYDMSLDSELLYELYSLLTITDVFVQTSGPVAIEVPKFSLYMPPPRRTHLDKWFQRGPKLNNLTCLRARSFNCVKIASDHNFLLAKLYFADQS